MQKMIAGYSAFNYDARQVTIFYMARGAPEMRGRDPKEAEAIKAELAQKRNDEEEAAFPELGAEDLKEVVEESPELIRLKAEREKQEIIMGDAVNAEQLKEAKQRLDAIMAELAAETLPKDDKGDGQVQIAA